MCSLWSAHAAGASRCRVSLIDCGAHAVVVGEWRWCSIRRRLGSKPVFNGGRSMDGLGDGDHMTNVPAIVGTGLRGRIERLLRGDIQNDDLRELFFYVREIKGGTTTA